MAYHDTIKSRALLLLKDPATHYKKIFPYLHSKLIYPKRMIYEKLGNFSLSKPYPAHQELLEKIQHIKNGFFVECGANDGYFQDPTYYLERKLGWTEILIEPLPISKKCRRQRPASTVYQYAVTSPEHANKLLDFIDVNAMSVIKDHLQNEKEWITAGEQTQKITHRHIKVPTRTIEDIIDEHFSKHEKKEIDLMVLDIEGYEINALKGLNFQKNSPQYLLIECHNDEREKEISDLLAKYGYNNVVKIGYIDFLFSKSIE